MDDAKRLRNVRDLLLKLHKALIDRERELYEGIHGRLTATEFLNMLIEDADLAWLRRFSTLIVEIDEMFAQKDGINLEVIQANLEKSRELVDMAEADEFFRIKYHFAIQSDPSVAGLHSEVKSVRE